jgi:hypothetical protein
MHECMFGIQSKSLRVVSNNLRRECAGTENRIYWSIFAAVEDISRKIPRVRETAVGEERVLTRVKPTMKCNVGILNVT